MRNYGIPQIRSSARILLICPDCGHENAEFAETLRMRSTYYCNGDDCDYIFDIRGGGRGDFGKGFAEACRRFYAAFYALRGQRAR
jgi:hypothetical protein